MLALKPADGAAGLVLRLQETAGRATSPALTLLGLAVALDEIAAHGIATWHIPPAGAARRTRATEIDPPVTR